MLLVAVVGANAEGAGPSPLKIAPGRASSSRKRPQNWDADPPARLAPQPANNTAATASQAIHHPPRLAPSIPHILGLGRRPLVIAPGLALVGIGLLLMRGLDVQSGWTHLIPGFIVAGVGTGLINPPLARPRPGW